MSNKIFIIGKSKGAAYAKGRCVCQRTLRMSKGAAYAKGRCVCQRALHMPKGAARVKRNVPTCSWCSAYRCNAYALPAGAPFPFHFVYIPAHIFRCKALYSCKIVLHLPVFWQSTPEHNRIRQHHYDGRFLPADTSGY